MSKNNSVFMKKCLKYFYLFIDQKSIKAFNTEVISKQEFLNSKLRFFFWKKKNQNVDTTKKLLKGTHTIAFFFNKKKIMCLWGNPISLNSKIKNFQQLRVHLVHWMRITIGIVIFITINKICCNVITKHIH